jgi:hypothetical protein
MMRAPVDGGASHTTRADTGTVAWSGGPEYNRGVRDI